MKKKRVTIGYIYCGKNNGPDEKAFLKVIKKKGLKSVFFNIDKEIEEEDLEKKAKECDIIFNNSAENFAFELVKTLEELGKKVVDSSRTYYYNEDKWMFFMKCKEHNIPTPNTVLLSENINLAKEELAKFKRWPVVLKMIEGCQGNFVEKADNMEEAVKVLEKFWKKSTERLPVIGQEMIHSKSYRVTIIDGKIVQTATKDNHGWKSTGVYQKTHNKFKVDKELKKIVDKTIKALDIKVCGLDFLKNGEDWLVLEANAVPAFDFFPEEREDLIGKVVDLLVKEAK